MQYVADFHLHSKYSRAVSKDMVLPIMADFAARKGFDILSASDWTHPLWVKEIKAQLEEAGEGLFQLKSEIRNSKSETNSNSKNSNDKKTPFFMLSTEISSIYTQGGKLRRIHNLVIAPSFETVEKISGELRRRGCNLNADGRPIIGISSKNLLEMILEIDERAMLIPCHVWTPHFGIYGSASGFDSLSEAFGDLAPYIYGIETGLSSDPEMNWQMSELNNRSILSFSDAHSPGKMGREATVFELSEPSYENIRKAIMRSSLKTDNRKLINAPSSTFKNPSSTFNHLLSNRIIYTIEFYPEEGKYHFSGHRNCKVVFGPEDIKEKGTTCPVCKRRLTEGVLLRVQQLGDQDGSKRLVTKTNNQGLKWYTDATRNHPPYVKLVPLLEIIAESMESTAFSQKVKSVFNTLCDEVGSEIDILLKMPLDDIARVSNPKIAEGVMKIRTGNIIIEPGFDGEYGKVKIWSEHEEGKKQEEVNEEDKEQLGLF